MQATNSKKVLDIISAIVFGIGVAICSVIAGLGILIECIFV